MQLKGNYIDLIIILVLLYYGSEAWRHGFWIILVDFISFFGSLLFSLRIYKFASAFLIQHFTFARSLANALGFLLVAIFSEVIFSYVLASLLSLLPKKFLHHKLNKILGILPGIGEGVIFVAFVLTLAIAFPVSPKIKADISESTVGGYLLEKTTSVEKSVNEVFGGVIEDSLTYLTVKTESKESIPLQVESEKLSIDEKSESQIFALVNEERAKMGVTQLAWDPQIVPIARAHAQDMWERKYFSHFSPEGKDVGDRLNEAGILYTVAGENLALAPTVNSAHTGLMNSEGHRRNILDPNFHKVGIGVIDNGVYGKMFVQVFTN